MYVSVFIYVYVYILKLYTVSSSLPEWKSVLFPPPPLKSGFRGITLRMILF